MTDLREAAQMALPCPFCGGKDISTHEGSTFRWYVAECMTCGAQGSEVRRQTLGQGTTDLWIKKAAADAIAEWNTRAALAQPEQEPVAWIGFNERGECREVFTRDMKKLWPNYSTQDMTPLYTAQPKGEAILHTVHCECGAVYKVDEQPYKQIKPPKKKEWQGLTDEEVIKLGGLDKDSDYFGLWYDFARAIEAKLKEKNGNL